MADSTSIEHRASIEYRGCQLSYRVRGNGPPVLMIQGVNIHGDGWRPQIDGLADRYCCLSFDNRGSGRSLPIGTPLSIEQMAEDALELINIQGWDSAHVVGHSMGGLIALQLALTARERVRSLALLCTFARGRDATQPSLKMIWSGMRARIGTRRQRRHAFLEIVMPKSMLVTADRDALAERLAPIFGHDLADQSPIVMKQLSAMRAYDATSRLGELSGLPTLIVNAAHDLISPPVVGRKLAANIPGANYIEIAEASHGVTIQCAEQINKLLLNHFLQVKI